MKIKDLFDVEYGVNLELINCFNASYPEGVNFVARTSENNGVVARVQIIQGVKPQPAGTISCAGGGSVLSTFVQEEPYYSGRDLYILTPKQEMTLVEKLYYCHLINYNKYRYNYGRQANRTLEDIELPDAIPSWIYEINIGKLKNNVVTKISSNDLRIFRLNGKNSIYLFYLC